jgi:hypothetical protein
MLVSGHGTHDLYKIMGDVNLRTEFEIIKVKVPIIFSARWVSRHLGRDVNTHSHLGSLSNPSLQIPLHIIIV